MEELDFDEIVREAERNQMCVFRSRRGACTHKYKKAFMDRKEIPYETRYDSRYEYLIYPENGLSEYYESEESILEGSWFHRARKPLIKDDAKA